MPDRPDRLTQHPHVGEIFLARISERGSLWMSWPKSS